MARRFNSRYFIELAEGQVFKTSFGEFSKALRGRWIERVEDDSRTARLSAGVVGRIRGSVLWLRDKFRECYLRTSSAAVDKLAPRDGWQADVELDYHPNGKGVVERFGWVYTGFFGMGADRLRELIEERKAAKCGAD
jgi:hypothetical protein